MHNSSKYCELRRAIHVYCNQKGISTQILANQIGVPHDAIVDIEQNNWEMITELIMFKIQNFISFLDEKVIETSNFTTIYGLCADALNLHKMLAIVGYTGAGKTFALKCFCNEYPNTHYMVARKSMSARQFLRAIVQQLGIDPNDLSGNNFKIIQKISDELNSQRESLLIIDDAGVLSPRMLQYLYEIRENTQEHSAIIMAGVEYFQTNFQKWVAKHKEGMPEIYRRINYWQHLTPPTKSEVKAILNAYGITDQEKVKANYGVKDFGTLYNAVMAELVAQREQNKEDVKAKPGTAST